MATQQPSNAPAAPNPELAPPAAAASFEAFRLKKPEKPIPAIQIEAPVKDILGIAVAWGAKHHEF
jgi:hypothetical protein